jgi:spore coat protein CotF
VANILLPFVTTFDDKGVKKGQASLGSLAKSSLAGALSVGVVVDQLGKAVRAAAEDQKAQEQLELAVRNNTTANTEQIAEMEKTIGRMEMQKAVADDELRPALGNLVRATGDVTKAQGLLNLSLDISAATGRDLQSVSIALAKAQTGNITALTRLGIPLDAAAVKSKDLDAIQESLALRFAGASDAAAASADGGMKKLQIALDNTYEAVGYKLLPIVSDYATVLADLSSKALNAEEENSKFGKAVNYLGRELLPVFKILPFINKQVSNYANNMSEATTFTEDFVRIGRLQNMNLSKETVVLKDNDKAQRSATEAKKKARQAAKEHADTLRDRVQTAYENVTEKVKDAQTQFDNFKTSLHDQVTGFVSLSDAVRTQADADSNFADALQERRQAYADLAKQDPVKDADAYAEALLNVASAENKLSAAATVRASADYSSVFSKQIEDAKKFARNLQELLGRGLGQAGLAQLLNLGPVAGYSVTEDMLSGARGISLSSFNESLASLSAAGTSLGTTGANAFFGTQLSNATSAQGQVNQYQITVNAGLVSNPAQVGRDIIEAIKSAERVSGQVFVSV